jgi:hypothetical protein
MILDDFKPGECFYDPSSVDHRKTWGLIITSRNSNYGQSETTLECIDRGKNKYICFNIHARVEKLDRSKIKDGGPLQKITKQEFLSKFFKFLFEGDKLEKDFHKNAIKYGDYDMLSKLNF